MATLIYGDWAGDILHSGEKFLNVLMTYETDRVIRYAWCQQEFMILSNKIVGLSSYND